MNRILGWFAVLVLAMCSATWAQGPETVVTDSLGRSVHIPVPVRRVVSLSASGVECIRIMERIDTLVGITEHTKTDLTSAQLAWLAESAALCGTDGLTMATMPGSAAWIGGGSYYVLDAAQVADLVNEKLNPYQKEVTAMDLAIRAG